MDKKMIIFLIGKRICWWLFNLNKFIILMMVLYKKIEILKNIVSNIVNIIIVLSFFIKFKRFIFLMVINVGKVDFFVILILRIVIFKFVV